MFKVLVVVPLKQREGVIKSSLDRLLKVCWSRSSITESMQAVALFLTFDEPMADDPSRNTSRQTHHPQKGTDEDREILLYHATPFVPGLGGKLQNMLLLHTQAN